MSVHKTSRLYVYWPFKIKKITDQAFKRSIIRQDARVRELTEKFKVHSIVLEKCLLGVLNSFENTGELFRLDTCYITKYLFIKISVVHFVDP